MADHPVVAGPMPDVIRYLTHPQVAMAADVPVPQWPLNDVGAGRVADVTGCTALDTTIAVFSSAETKAVQTAVPVADALGLSVQIVERMHENDRSATGFLPPAEFEKVADAFFAQPSVSVRGWETAEAAQTRIVGAALDAINGSEPGDILLVGHGGVGTLLYCAWAGYPISRRYDQHGGGGCFITFDRSTRAPLHHWRVMEDLLDQGA